MIQREREREDKKKMIFLLLNTVSYHSFLLTYAFKFSYFDSENKIFMQIYYTF